MFNLICVLNYHHLKELSLQHPQTCQIKQHVNRYRMNSERTCNDICNLIKFPCINYRNSSTSLLWRYPICTISSTRSSCIINSMPTRLTLITTKLTMKLSPIVVLVSISFTVTIFSPSIARKDVLSLLTYRLLQPPLTSLEVGRLT